METSSVAPKADSVSIKDTKEVLCPCGHNFFKEVLNLREVSELLTGTGRKEYVPMPVLICDKCGKRVERPSNLIGV
jgi:hypothetical protein